MRATLTLNERLASLQELPPRIASKGVSFGVRYQLKQGSGQAKMIGRDDIDPLAPQREAAMFYGLFLRGHPADDLRRDIDVPRPLLEKWLQPQRYESDFRDNLRRIYTYRKKVLAIFDELVTKERHRARIN